MIRKEYPHLFEDDPALHEAAQQLAAKTYELSEFLVQVAGWMPAHEDTEDGEAVTYHDSCHMCRMLGLGAEPRSLLQAAGREIWR